MSVPSDPPELETLHEIITPDSRRVRHRFSRLVRDALHAGRGLPGFGLLLLAAFGALAAEPKRVLVVHSFGSAAPPFTTVSTAFESTLTGEMGEPVDLDEVSLDVARYATLDIEEALVELMRKRQTKWQPDLVVPIGSPAGIFVAQYRARLFPAETPILYTGMDRRRLPPGALGQNAAFIGASYDLPGAVEDILQVAPATTNIVVVIGATPLEQFWTDVLRREYERFTNRVGFTWFNDLSFDQMLERSSKLPPHSFMLLVLLMRDASGVTHNADEALRRIHAVANAPVNGLFRNQLGMGIVGGRLYADDAEGSESARTAIRILRGEPASSFPPRVIPPSPPQYDARELQRWELSEARLPPGSTVLFREPTVWDRYKWRIVAIVSVCVGEALLITLLLANLVKRRRAERSLAETEAERKEAEQAAREFGGRLLHAQETERARLARELHDDITQRLARLAIDAGRVELGTDGAVRNETMREVRDGLVRLSEDVHSLSYKLHPALLEDLGLADALKAECERFTRQESIPVEIKLDDLPAEIPHETGLCLFRITQEALRNVARHAHADTAKVLMRRLDDGLQLAVADTGVGFDPAQQRHRPSLGLASMRERVRLVGGELDVESSPGLGTTIVAWVPFGKAEG